MGQATSTDFRVETAEWVKTDIALNDVARWKMVFTTHMEPHEVAMFLPPSELRYLRRFRPSNLTKLLYKCIEQLRFAASAGPQFDESGKFVGQMEGATAMKQAAASDTTTSKKAAAALSGKPVLDYTSAKNSIRIIGAVLPYLFEPLDETAKRQLDTHEKLLERVARNRGEEIKEIEPSPFGADLATHFLWRNMTCEGDHLGSSGMETFDTSAQGPEQMPFGEELVKLLTRLAFTPHFTVAPHQRFLDKEDASGEVSTLPTKSLRSEWKNDLGVHPELLWFQGHGAPSGPSGKSSSSPGKIPSSHSADIRQHRIELMRCLVACLTEPLFNPHGTKGILTHNHMLEVLVNRRKCPLVPTLCLSLMNCIENFNSRGILPYTSHYFAEAGEHCLALSMQLLGLLLTPPMGADGHVERTAIQIGSGDASLLVAGGEGGGDGENRSEESAAVLTPEEATAAAVAGGGGNGDAGSCAVPLIAVQPFSVLDNSPYQMLHKILTVPRYSTVITQFIKSLFRVIGNPLYATHQTWMSGSQKVVHCYQEAVIVIDRIFAIDKVRDAATELTPELIAPLFYFSQEAKVEYQFFGATQAATMALLSLSTHPHFIQGLQAPTNNAKPVLQALPGISNSNWGDILVLMICSTISPSSPRYMSCFYDSYSTLLVNVLPQMKTLHATTSFELHHLLDFVCTERFLRRGGKYQKCSSNVVEALVSFVIHQPMASRQFYAVLGVGEVPQRLAALVEKAAIVKQQEQASGGADQKAAASDKDPLVDDDDDEEPRSDSDEDQEEKSSGSARQKKKKKAGGERKLSQTWQALDPELLPARHLVSQLATMHSESASAVAATTSRGEAGLEEMRLFKGSGGANQPLHLRRYDLGRDENLRWLQAYLWGMVYRHNVNPPLFDLAKVTTFDTR